MSLHPGDFADFFHAIHGHKPFPWQQALLERLAETDKWPDVLDLPTGSGKTATLDIAVFHLALRKDTPQKAALRIALVVDRRLVVDNAHAHAEKIAGELNNSKNKVIKEVAFRLQRLAGDDAKPLVTRRLRGGAPLEHDWARTPTQPVILCSTVDQVGSRLLFRGYGVSDRMKSVHAGLLGADSLILLDEAHLSEPFQKTLDAVGDENIGKAKVKAVLLSATPEASGKTSEAVKFELTEKDFNDPTLKRRLNSPKPAELKKISNADAVAKNFAKTAQIMANELLQAGVANPAVGVIVNRVGLARDVSEELKKTKTMDGGIAFDAELMIGRSRSVDREKIANKLKPFLTGSSERSNAPPLFIVATQCLEVGVDIDLDGLVTQAASFDALRQRFGRLNRSGRELPNKQPAKGVIIALPEDIKKTADDPVYGKRICKTWEALNRLAENEEIDFGIKALDSHLDESGFVGGRLAELSAPHAPAPVAMPAYLDLWSQTSPRPAADPEIGLFLHGAERMSPEVSIVWRSDVSTLIGKGKKENLKDLMKLVPPRTSEAISVPLWAARAWLRQAETDASQLGEIADAPAASRGGFGAGEGKPRRTFRWAGADDPHTDIVRPDDLRAGDMLIVPTEYGGCDVFGWAPAYKNAVEDVADKAARPFRAKRFAVRVTPDVAEWEHLSKILKDESIQNGDLVENLCEGLPLESDAKPNDEASGINPSRRSVRESLEKLKTKKIVSHSPYTGDRGDGVVLVAVNGLEGEGTQDIAFPSTEDDTLSETSTESVRLDKHGKDVEDFAKRFTETLNLENEITADLCLAAFLHDAGKADQRFQTMLTGGDPWNRPDMPALAKSGQNAIRGRGAGKRAGLPDGWRHEALSVLMAQAHPRFKEAYDPALVLWLIGTHHGHGRPFFHFTDEVENTPKQELLPCLDVKSWTLEPEKTGPQSPAFEFDHDDWLSLSEHLKKKYGIWKLAHFEAILRLADHRASEMEGEKGAQS